MTSETGSDEEFAGELSARLAALKARPNGGYPDDYRDPDYDGTVKGFGDVVIPARVKALEQSLNETFADLLPEGCRFEYGLAGD